jgi:threonylcarbamoyladenosine tRNA methylthiotransferase MtaB
MALRVYVESIGCKLNQSERDMLARQFAAAGWDVVLDAEEADVCVVNTCAVTHVAGRKSRQRFLLLRRLNPSARLVATGCYTGVCPEVVGPPDVVYPPDAGCPPDGLNVDLVVSNVQKQDLVPLVQAELSVWGLGGQRPASGGAPEVQAAASPSAPEREAGVTGWARALRPRTRPLVKIQDGCDNACTYCIVRTLRGPQRSRPRQDVLYEIANLVHQGYREVVLTGVHVGSYGHDSGDTLSGLVRAILDTSPPDRLRLSSIEPWDLTDAFLSLWDDPRLCRHLHLPLQSGCDVTLQRMNRRYTADQYAAWVAQARAAIPGLALTTDVIAGFPGETEEEHAASAAFVERMAFARVHVFAYSPRPGTAAAEMPDSVDLGVRQKRAAQIREIGRRSGEAFRRQHLGCTLPVLWEIQRVGTRARAKGRWSGLTDNYIRVYTWSERDLANTLCPTRLCVLEPGGVRGELVEPSRR